MDPIAENDLDVIAALVERYPATQLLAALADQLRDQSMGLEDRPATGDIRRAFRSMTTACLIRSMAGKIKELFGE